MVALWAERQSTVFNVISSLVYIKQCEHSSLFYISQCATEKNQVKQCNTPKKGNFDAEYVLRTIKVKQMNMGAAAVG